MDLLILFLIGGMGFVFIGLALLPGPPEREQLGSRRIYPSRDHAHPRDPAAVARSLGIGWWSVSSDPAVIARDIARHIHR